MSGLFGKQSNATAPQQLNSISVDRSRYGDPVPLVYGTQRIPATLLWYGAFTVIPQSQQSSGKGGGGAQITGYLYTASCVMGLCEGPITAVRQVFKDKAITTYAAEGLSLFTGAGGQAAWSYLTTNFPSQAVPYDHTAYFGAQNLSLGSSAALPNYTYEVQGFLATGGTAITLTAAPGVGATSAVISGTSPITTGVWDVSFSDYEVRSCTFTTTTGTTTITWDVTNGLVNACTTAAVIGGFDADPSAIILDYCTDVNHGAGFNNISSSIQGTGNTYQTYCLVNSLQISPWEDTQRPAADFLKDILEITNSDAVMSAGVMNIFPYCDATISANGLTYTPNLTPLFAFTDDDYVIAGNANINDPVVCERKPMTETYNVVRVEFYDRANNYNAALAEWTDPLDIATNGIRVMATKTFHQITNASVAYQVASLIGQRQLYIRNTYIFAVRADVYTLLEPMDLISITDSNLGIVNKLCRIVQVEDDKDDTFTITCEDMFVGTASAPKYNYQSAQGYYANYAVLPPNTWNNVIFSAPNSLCANQEDEIWIATCAATPTGVQTNSYGGCNIWSSLDNATWNFIGTATGQSRIGTVTTGHAIGASDTTIYLTLAPELVATGLVLDSASASDFAANRALLWVDGEVMAFQTVTLLSAGNYSVTVSRGLFSTTPTNGVGVAHAVGTYWARLDSTIFRIATDPGIVGQTVYFEFYSFNAIGRQTQTTPGYTASYVVPAFNQVFYSTFAQSGSCRVVAPSSAYKFASASSAWDSSVYSTQSFANACSASWSFGETNTAMMVGLSANPSSSNNYTNIAYGFETNGGFAQWSIYALGSFVGITGSFTPTDTFCIAFDGKHVNFIQNGAIVYSTPQNSAIYSMQACFYSPNASIYGIVYENIGVDVSPFTLLLTSTNVVAKGNATSSITGASAWGTKVFESRESYANGVQISFNPGTLTGAYYMGVTSNPATALTGAYAGVFAGWYCHGDSSVTQAIFNVATYLSLATPALTDVLAITYDGFNVYWWRNGTIEMQQYWPTNVPLYLVGDFYEVGLKINNISFSPYGQLSPNPFVTGGNAVTHDSTASKIGGSNAWDSGVASINGYATCHVQGKLSAIGSAVNDCFIGLTSTPQSLTALGNYTYLNYTWHFNGSSGDWEIYESGTAVLTAIATAATTDLVAVTYSGSTITYLLNGVSKRTVSVSGLTLFAGFDYYYANSPGTNSMSFGPGTTLDMLPTASLDIGAATGVNTVFTAGPVTYSESSLGVITVTPSTGIPTLALPAPVDANHVLIVTLYCEITPTNLAGGSLGFQINVTWSGGGLSSPPYYASNAIRVPFTIQQTFALPANLIPTVAVGTIIGLSQSLEYWNINMQAEIVKR